MRPDFSVLFLTTLIGAGQGLFLALVTVQLKNGGGLNLTASGGVVVVFGDVSLVTPEQMHARPVDLFGDECRLVAIGH